MYDQYDFPWKWVDNDSKEFIAAKHFYTHTIVLDNYIKYILFIGANIT